MDKTIFEGRFYLLSSEDLIKGVWVPKDLDIASCYYDFFSAAKIVYSDDDICFEGALTEYEGELVNSTQFCHEIEGARQRLAIDRSIYYDNGDMEACFEERFTIEQLPDGTMYLYLVEVPDTLPPCLRLRIKRDKSE